MNIIDRIKQIIDYKQVSVRKFCIEIGVANGFLDKVKDVGSDKVAKILYTYSDINAEWLVTGNGEMIKKDESLLDVKFVDNNFLLERIEKLAIENYELKKENTQLKSKPYKENNGVLTAAEPEK